MKGEEQTPSTASVTELLSGGQHLQTATARKICELYLVAHIHRVVRLEIRCVLAPSL